MIVNHTLQFVFAHVPKTGGTSLRSALSQFDGNDPGIVASTTHETPAQFLNRRETEGCAHRPALVHYKWLMFVRDPWDRFASLHRFLLERHFRKYPDVPQDINDFATLLRSPPDWALRIKSLRPQCDYLSGMEHQFVGRFEHMAQDTARLAEYLGCDITVAHLNATQPRSSEMSPATRNFIAQIYQSDIETFGYG